MRIAQLVVTSLSARASGLGHEALGSHYQGQTGATLSRAHIQRPA